jgi:hypothetical protein
MPPPVLVTLRITIVAHGDAGGRGIQPISGNQHILFGDGFLLMLKTAKMQLSDHFWQCDVWRG